MGQACTFDSDYPASASEKVYSDHGGHGSRDRGVDTFTGKSNGIGSGGGRLAHATPGAESTAKAATPPAPTPAELPAVVKIREELASKEKALESLRQAGAQRYQLIEVLEQEVFQKDADLAKLRVGEASRRETVALHAELRRKDEDIDHLKRRVESEEGTLRALVEEATTKGDAVEDLVSLMVPSDTKGSSKAGQEHPSRQWLEMLEAEQRRKVDLTSQRWLKGDAIPAAAPVKGTTESMCGILKSTVPEQPSADKGKTEKLWKISSDTSKLRTSQPRSSSWRRFVCFCCAE
eukprot:gnl/TRDRNA2_/TRDRNA2_192973_c0_seq1.p1 gnl/TRDRNA2_/TRDRNA2_192973_c0~~gnl/TRDRNA2_/TRDRNA2_192973_c0_seq1.p1  ORF type:complete len:292 (-),score=65.22 gnl/TRDRNA2_/TRDRNA2_192973_c0_seq1:75-950(-)